MTGHWLRYELDCLEYGDWTTNGYFFFGEIRESSYVGGQI